ncbi:SMI1 / KNR4 family [Delftia tsuruhatensis]|uniref:SMI1/KNR4 family protein n=1 Tax=Delftia tsuruhatensis TaxID=180282 RepID=UPI001E77A66F|nr:SMI1/KNR4 family protein [Delftia tsuruhatensis]CAB5723535.1 SMI1 / KNR4 family [Delftia tsuruhatensis]CAC9693315.1 SMI1 / KNR4 family [Delftia tsuruhatensis]
MKEDLLDRVADYLSQYQYSLLPNTPEDIKSAEAALGFSFEESYKLFLENFGGCYAGISIYGMHNNELLEKTSIAELTNDFKAGRWPIQGNYCVISMDGSGNPIYTTESGKIFLFDHDNGKEELLFSSFEEMLEFHLG